MDIQQHKLFSLLESVLGDGKVISESETVFKCPFSNHRKPKLAINLATQRWQSWIDTQAKGKSIYALFKKLRVSPEKFKELAKIAKMPRYYSTDNTQSEEEYIRLPSEFKSLKEEHRDIQYKHAMRYLRERGIYEYDVERYNVGYCSEGEYANRVIVPSYDKNNDLNYFIARDYTGNSYIKYKNPKVNKNVVVFENQLDFSEPLVLCEGVFDAIAIRRNATALLGKTIPKLLHERIMENHVKEVCVVLDNDAFETALSISEKLMNENIKVTLVKLKDKDPSEIGFCDMVGLMKSTPELTLGSLVKHRLCL